MGLGWSTVSLTGSDGVVAVALARARRLGFVGPGPVDRHVAHGMAFAQVIEQIRREHGEETTPPRVLDLGSGGGVPGLVLATRWSQSSLVLLDAAKRRAAFLRQAAMSCQVDERVTVVEDRAENAGRASAWRGGFDVVVARSFGRPAVVAECAAPFLRVGGLLVVSEPPDERAGGARWPTDPLETLGLVPLGLRRGRFGFEVLRQVYRCPDRYPRRVGVPEKRPLF